MVAIQYRTGIILRYTLKFHNNQKCECGHHGAISSPRTTMLNRPLYTRCNFISGGGVALRQLVFNRLAKKDFGN